MAIVFDSSSVTIFWFVSFFFPHLLMVLLVKMVEQVLAKHVQFLQKSVTQVSPSLLTGHLVKDYCSYVHNFKAGFLYSKCLFS